MIIYPRNCNVYERKNECLPPSRYQKYRNVHALYIEYIHKTIRNKREQINVLQKYFYSFT